MGVAIVVPLGSFAMIVAIVWLIVAGANTRKKATLKTIEEAFRSGQPVTKETIQALGMPRRSDVNGDLKSGFILVAIAVACLLVGLLFDAMLTWGSIAAFPGLIGLVLVAFGLTAKKTDASEG